LPESLKTRLEELNHQRLKTIYSYPIFEDIDRDIIKEEFHHFHFTTFKFHEYLYHEYSRDHLVYFIKVKDQDNLERIGINNEFMQELHVGREEYGGI